MTREEAQLAAGYIIPPEWAYVPVGDAAFFIVKGNEIHCWRDERIAGRWITRRDIDAVTAPLLKEFGYVFTSVENGNEVGQRFVERLGFTKSQVSPTHCFYVSRRMAHLRKKARTHDEP